MRAIAAGAFLLALTLALAACRTQPPERVLYQWSDADGNVRYTTVPGGVPRGSRDTLARVVPGRSAQVNAAELPGARTEPRPPPTTKEWLQGQPPEETDAGAAASAAEVAEEAAVPTKAEDVAALDARIHELEQQITEMQVAQRIEESADPESVDDGAASADADRLAQAQAELEELRTRRGLITPADGP